MKAIKALLMRGIAGAPPSTPKQHWRLLFPDGGNDSTNNRAGVAEIEFRATVGGADQTSNDGGVNAARASASSSFSGAFHPRQAFNDGYVGFEGWLTANNSDTNAWIAYDFITPVTVNQVMVAAFDDGSQNMAPREITIQSSTDGITWVTEWVVSGGPYTWTAGQIRTFTRP